MKTVPVARASQPIPAQPSTSDFDTKYRLCAAFNAKISIHDEWLATIAPRAVMGVPLTAYPIDRTGNAIRQTACVIRGVQGRATPNIGLSTNRTSNSSISPR